jgi:hypothetical protein
MYPRRSRFHARQGLSGISEEEAAAIVHSELGSELSGFLLNRPRSGCGVGCGELAGTAYCRTSGTAVVPLKDVAMQFAIARCVQFQFRLFSR